MSVKTYIKKSFNVLLWCLEKISKKAYVKLYPKYLSWLGIKVDAKNCEQTWISPTVFFDSSQYDLIEIGKNVTISFGVKVLVHDFSIKHAARAICKEDKVKSSIRQPVKIGNNVFIGAETMILPGTVICDNCIVGGGL